MSKNLKPNVWRVMGTTLKHNSTVLWDVSPGQKTFYVEQLPPVKRRPYYESCKRLFDITASLVLLAILPIALIVMADSPFSIHISSASGKECWSSRGSQA